MLTVADPTATMKGYADADIRPNLEKKQISWVLSRAVQC